MTAHGIAHDEIAHGCSWSVDVHINNRLNSLQIIKIAYVFPFSVLIRCTKLCILVSKKKKMSGYLVLQRTYRKSERYLIQNEQKLTGENMASGFLYRREQSFQKGKILRSGMAVKRLYD